MFVVSVGSAYRAVALSLTGDVWKTQDQGQTWEMLNRTLISSGSWTAMPGKAIQMLTETIIYLVDTSNKIHVSNDFGYSWNVDLSV